MGDFISYDTLRALLARLNEGATLVGPADTGKTVEFRKATAGEVLFDDRVSYKSLKEYYFPQAEKLFTFSGDEVAESAADAPYVLFGGRSCDLEALRVMRAVFLEGRYGDPFFARRMDANLLIGVGCEQKKPGCFCDALGIDREFSHFCDIFLSPAPGGYTLEHVGEKGRAAMKLLPETRALVCDNARSTAPPKRTLAIDASVPETALFNAVDWGKLTEACQGCGMCTYICPTCHCFAFRDVEKGTDVERLRCWDSCMYPRFTLHASGHNPRASKAERYRQRVLHKYVYVPQNTGLIACTGCGRCIRSCPAGMSIRTVTQAVQTSQEERP